MKNNEKYDIFLYFIGINVPIKTIRNEFTIDSEPPSLNDIIFSWGNVLNYEDSIVTGNILVKTNNLEESQPVSVNFNGIILTGTSNNNTTIIYTPYTLYNILQQNVTYSVTASFKDKAQNEYVQPANQIYFFLFTPKELVYL